MDIMNVIQRVPPTSLQHLHVINENAKKYLKYFKNNNNLLK